MELYDLERSAASLAPLAWPEDRDNPHLADCLIARLAEETGELAQAVRLLAGPRMGHPEEAGGSIEQVEDELGDCLFVLARLALATGASLEAAAQRVVAKIERRIRDAADSPASSRKR